MTMKVRYTVIDGEIIAEKRSGVRRQYVPDPLGSTVALLDNTQTPTDTFTYWPYGEEASRTGTTPTPFQYVGTAGYRQDSSSKTYVRTRVLDTQKGRWMTQDPIGYNGGDVNLYRDVANNPVSLSDPEGLAPTASPTRPKYYPDPWNNRNKCFHNNCYSYGCNTPGGEPGSPMPPNTPGYLAPQPGGGVPNPCSCASVIQAIRRGGLLKPRQGGSCPPGTFTVIMFVDTTPPCDYHFIRLDGNGKWSDKRGAMPVGPQFGDPYTHAKMEGYGTVCQQYCAPNRKAF